MPTSRDQLIAILRTLEPYRPLAHGLGVFVQSKYADEIMIHKLGGFVQEAIAAIRLSSVSEKQRNTTHLHKQAELKKQQDLDEAEDLLAGLAGLGEEKLEQNQIDSNTDKIVDPNELRNLVPDLTSKERKKLAQDLSSSPEVQTTMLESCNKIYADVSLKIMNGEVLTKEDIELFQLSVYMLGKNTNIVIDGIITPGKLTEQLIKEINPEYFRVGSLIQWFGPDCKIDINALWLARSVEERTLVFEKVQEYREILIRLHAEPEDMGKTLYNVFVQGINSRGKFDDKERFDDLDARIRKAQSQLEKQQEAKAKQKAFQEKQQLILSIEKSIPTLNEQLLQLGKDLENKQNQYATIYQEFATVLKENNTFWEKAKAVSPYLLAAATGPIGPLILTLRSKTSLSPNEMQQLVLYEKLAQKYNEIVQLQNTIKKARSTIEQKAKQQQCLYYEILRDSGKRAVAEQALINLINQYGDPIRKQYAADVQLYMQDASEINQALFMANKAKLNAIVQQKNRAIDITQQLMTGEKPQWGMMDVAGLQYLPQDDIGGIIGNEGLQQANMMGEMVAVRDNTANVRIIQTQELVTEQGNRMHSMGLKKGYETVGGTTSTQGNILYAQYQVATNQFKTLTVPGMGSINVKIDPGLYNQIISFSEKGKQLTFDPIYNPALQCFEINSSSVFITRVDKQGTVAYQARPGIGEPINYITKKEYQSLLQVKKGLTGLVTEQAPIMEVLSYQEQLQQVAAPIQQLAQLYSQTPGDALLSDTVIRDLTKPGGLKDQLASLKMLLAKHGSYQTIIAELKQNRSGVYDQYEQQLYAVERMLQGLPGFVTQIDGLLNYSIWEHADARTLKEFAITMVAIIGGVLLAVATGGMASGVSAMVVSAAAGSLGGMVSSRLAQDTFASMTDTGGLTNDLHTDIGKCMSGQAKWEDVLPNVAMEFAQGTATTLMFMGAGRIIGQQLEKFVTANAGVVSREVKVAYRTRKAISKLNDNEIQLLEKKGFGKFVIKLQGEMKEEFAQEGAQQTGEKGGNAVGSALDKVFGVGSGLGSGIGALISIITSIGGKTQYRAGKVDVFMEGHDTQTNATTVSYKGDADQLRSMLQANFDESGYTFDGIDPDGNLVYSRLDGDKAHRIIFTTTQESSTIKEIDLPTHGQIYGIVFDEKQTQTDEPNTYHYTYESSVVGNNNLTKYLARNGMVVVDGIAEDGSFIALAKNGEKIVFNQKPVEQIVSNPNSPVLTEATTDVTETVPGAPVDVDQKTASDLGTDVGVDTEQIIAADQKQIDEGLTELEQELDAPIQDEKSIQSSLGRIVQSLRSQLQRAKGFAESVQQNPLLALHTNIVRLYQLISKRSPEMWARSISSDHLRELSTMCSGFIVEYGLVLGPLVGIVAIVTSLSSKLQVITQMKLQQHMQNKLDKLENIQLPTDKYGKPVYQTDAGVELTSTQAVDVYKKNLSLANRILSAIPGAVFLIKTSFHLNSTMLLPSDVDVALNYETGKQLVEYLISGDVIPETDGLVFEDVSKHPAQEIPLTDHKKLLAACEAGTLRIAYNTHIDGVTIEHELFVENTGKSPQIDDKNKGLAVFDTQGKPLDTVMVDVDGVMVPHLGEKTAIKYLSELVNRGFDQLMDGSDTKGKFFKRLRDLGDTKNTLGYLNAVNVFINNIRSWVENKIGFKRGDEYQKQISELKKSGKFKMLFDYIPANHPALNSPVQLNRDLDKDIYNLNEQCMSMLRSGDAKLLGSTLLRVEQLLRDETASLDQLVHLAALKLFIVTNAPDLQSNGNADAMKIATEHDPLVLHNAAITDDNIRLSNIRQQLGMSEDQELTQEQEQALLAAHYYNPKGQGVYGYDKRILIEKAWIATGRYEIEVVDGAPRVRLDEAGNLVLRQTADSVATTDLISMQQAKDLIRSGLLGMPNPAKELSPTVVQEARDVLAGQEYTELSQELLLSLVPPRVYEVASNPDNVRVMQYRNTNGEISLIVYEQDSPKALTDEAAYAQRQADIAAARAQGKITLPKAPPGVDRLHAKFETVFNKGKLGFQDRILMSCKLSLLSNTPQTLSVVEFDGESHQGIGQDFYTATLPDIAKQLDLRFVVGQNSDSNISFFKDILGRYSRDQIKPEYRDMFAGSGSDSLFTIQFLYQEDVAKYVDEKYIRKVDQDSDSQKEIIVSEFATALMGNVIFSQQVESLGDELLIQGIVAKYFTAGPTKLSDTYATISAQALRNIVQLKQDGLINDDNEVLVIAIAHIDPTLFGDVGIGDMRDIIMNADSQKLKEFITTQQQLLEQGKKLRRRVLQNIDRDKLDLNNEVLEKLNICDQLGYDVDHQKLQNIPVTHLQFFLQHRDIFASQSIIFEYSRSHYLKDVASIVQGLIDSGKFAAIRSVYFTANPNATGREGVYELLKSYANTIRFVEDVDGVRNECSPLYYIMQSYIASTNTNEGGSFQIEQLNNLYDAVLRGDIDSYLSSITDPDYLMQIESHFDALAVLFPTISQSAYYKACKTLRPIFGTNQNIDIHFMHQAYVALQNGTIDVFIQSLRDIQKQIAFANAFGQIIFLFDIQKSRHYAVYQRMQAIYPPDSIASRFVRTFDKGPTSNVLLELAIEEGKHKDRSNNSYDGVQIEREIEYDSINQLAVDQTDDVGVIKLRFTYTEQFESNPLSDMGALEDQVVHDVKMIMVQYGVRFDTAFFLYRMEFLKRNKSLYFTPSDNANLEKFMQEQSYDPSRLSADELIALRQYQTGYIGNINNLLRFNRGNPNQQNIARILIPKLKSALQKNTIQKETTLYRLLYGDGLGVVSSLQEGDTFVDDGFVSTSFTDSFQKKQSKVYKESVILKISAPVGTPYALLDQHFSGGSTIAGFFEDRYDYTGQEEVVLGPGHTFTVKRISKNEEGVTVYEVELGSNQTGTNSIPSPSDGGNDNPTQDRTPDSPTGGSDIAPPQTEQTSLSPNQPLFDNLKGYTDAGYIFVKEYANMGPAGCKRIEITKDGKSTYLVQMNGNIIFESSNKLLIQNGDGDATMVVLEPVGTGGTNHITIIGRDGTIVLQQTGAFMDQGIGLYGIGEVINEEGDMQGTAYDARGNKLNPEGYQLWSIDSSSKLELGGNVYTTIRFERRNQEDISEYLKGIRNKNEQKREFPPIYPDIDLRKDGSVELIDAAGNTRLTAIGKAQDGAEETIVAAPTYFNGDKKNIFKFTTEQATAHSDLVTQVEKDPANTDLRIKAKQEILDILKAKGVDLPEGFVIEDAFLDAIIKAHEIAGGEGEGLGSFSLGTLLNKRKALDAYLSTTSLNPEQQSAIARCLMEGGFCGKGIASILYYMIKGRSEYQDPNAGLPFEQRRAIAQQQLEQNGITDEQRSAYMPGLSEELYNNIDPSGYEIVDKIWDFFDPSEKQELDEMIKQHSDVYDNSKRKDARALYLGLPQRHNTFKTSEYKPSKAKENKTYFALQDEVRIFNQYKEAIDAFEEYKQALASGQTIKDLKADQKQRAKERKRDGAFDIREELIYAREQTLLNAYEQYEKQGTIVLQDFEIGKENVVTGDIEQKFDKGVMGQYTISTGIDPENGLHYMSYYDIWDLHPFTGPLKRLGDRLPGKPFEIYGRIYYNPQTMQIIDPDMYQSSTHNDRIDSQP